jgi:hypothetical protein
MKTAWFPTIRLLGGLATLLTLTVSGCAGGTGEISGMVRFKGTPLSTGRVTFTSQNDPTVSVYSLIGKDGSYKVTDCPTGPVKIAVQTVVPRSGQGLQGAKMGANGRPTPVTIPHRYVDPAKSDLDYVVTRGRQQHDIDLTP